jgi:hypothetical protein
MKQQQQHHHHHINRNPHNYHRVKFGKECPFIFLICSFAIYVMFVWNHHDQLTVVTTPSTITNDIPQQKRHRQQHQQPKEQQSASINDLSNTLLIDERPKKIPSSLLVNSTNVNRSRNSGKYAYAFLLGGASANYEGSDHRGGLYSVVVAAHTLRRQGSTADVVLMVQISSRSNATRLPKDEESVLRKSNIRVVYIPKYSSPQYEKFYALMMEKFRILTLDEYDRILYLDYDVMPRCNLDYMMELSFSRPDVLKENVVLAHLAEPSSGGFFILKPNKTDYRLLQRIVVDVENATMNMDFPHWDTKIGWGHPIVGPQDYWISSEGKKGYEWNWYGCQADQGLLYYWTKYVKRSVSILVTSAVEQWTTDPNTGRLLQERIDKGTIHPYSCSPGPKRRAAPYRDFVHLTGKKKPCTK